MQIHLQLSRRLGQLARSAEAWSLAGAIAMVLATEAFGRTLDSDIGDAVVIMTLVMLVVTFGFLYQLKQLRWIGWLWHPLREALPRLKSLTFEAGVDLRESPPIPSRVPPILVQANVTLFAAILFTAAWLVWNPVDPRFFARNIFYVGYASGLGLLWLASLASIALMVFMPAAHIHDLFVTNSPVPRRNVRVELLCMTGYFALVVAMGIALPEWVPTAVIAVTLVVGLLAPWIPPRRRLTLLWRDRRTSEVFSMQWPIHLSLVDGIVVMPFLCIALLGLGPLSLGGEAFQTLPITRGLGHVSAWLAAAGLSFMTTLYFIQGWSLRRHDPAMPAPTSIYVTNEVDQATREQIGAIARQAKWRVRFAPEAARPFDVGIEVVPPPTPRIDFGRPRWPLPISCEALELPELQHLLRRRDEIQRRRVLMRRLRTILGRAARRKYRSGTGYWVAPHYWFVSALTRDRYEEGLHGEGTMVMDILPPLYHRAIGRPARHHLARVCHALEVDLIFLEDGVGFRGLRRVLRAMFEHYDVHGGRQRIEEMHLAGLRGLKVIVHEFELDQPWEKKSYPEPDFEDLGRARIVHVFRDRGESSEIYDPTSVDRSVFPVAVG